MKINSKKKFSYLSLWLLCLSALWWSYTNAYTHDMFIWWWDSDNFVLHWHLIYWLVWNDAKTWKVVNWNSEVTQDPLVKYVPWIFWKWHLNKWKELERLTMSKDKDWKVVVASLEDVLKDTNWWWEPQYLRPYWDIKYQIEHPQSTSSLPLTEWIQVTTRPVMLQNPKFKSAKLYWTWNEKANKYEILDYWNKKRNVTSLPLKNLWNYKPYFVISMRSNLLWWTWQLNFVTRWKFTWIWKYLDSKANEYSNWLDAQAFYIADHNYNWVSWKNKSAVYIWRSVWMYFPNYLRDWAKLDDLQKWYRPQLVRSLPLMKITAWKWWNVNFKTSLYDQWVPKNHWLKQFTAKWQLYNDWETVYDKRLSSDKYSRDDQWYWETYEWEWLFPKADLIWKWSSENWLTWNNQLYRLWSWNNKPWVTSKDLTWMMYSYDHRYSYFTDIWFCWDWLTQTFAWEECDDWPSNWEWSCSLTCKKQENTCWNWKVDIVMTKDWKIDTEKSEECDWKMFEWKPVDMSILPTWLKWQSWLTYSWKNNPCYKPEEKDEYSKILDEKWKPRKACQWKMPYWTIALSPKDWEIKKWSDIRDITLSDLPIWANITTCQWYELKTANKDYWINKYKIPNIFEYPYVSYVVLPYLKWWVTPTSEQLQKIKWLDWICKLNLYKKDFELRKVYKENWWNKVKVISDPKKTNLEIIWNSIYKNWALNKPEDNDIKVWSQLTNNVAVRYWYNPHRETINTFINDEPNVKDKLSSELLWCNEIVSKEVWSNMYQLSWNFNPSKDVDISQELVNNLNSKFTFKFRSWREFLVNKPIKIFHKRWILKLPQLTKDEIVDIKVTWYDQLEKKTKEKTCEIKLKYQPFTCDMTLSKNWVNDPKVWSNPFDANHWIYSF